MSILVFAHDALSSCKGIVYMRAEIILSELIVESGLGDDLHWLLIYMGHDELYASGLALIREYLKILHRCRVNGADASHTEHERLRILLGRDRQYLAGRGKEHQCARAVL